jgi:hypothetical protein
MKFCVNRNVEKHQGKSYFTYANDNFTKCLWKEGILENFFN